MGVQCPYCGSYRTARQTGSWDWLWLVIGAGLALMRLVVSLVRADPSHGEPGMYRCDNCGQSFTFLA